LAEVSLKATTKAVYSPEDFENRLDNTGQIPLPLTQESWLLWRSSKVAAQQDTPERVHHRERIGGQTRFPAVLYQHYGQHLIVWLWARALDDSLEKHGENLGQGRATFRLSALAAAVNRSVSTVRRWLAGARDKGLIWRFHTTGDFCRLWYCSLERVAAPAGVSSLGSVAWIQVSDLNDLRIKATEVIAQGLQLQSFWSAKEAAKTVFKIKNPKIVPAEQLLRSPCENQARVVGRRGRFLYVTEGFLPYGAAQVTIGKVRGVCSRTVQRHLSDSYRLCPSPVRNSRSELNPCVKAQLAQRVPKTFPVERLKSSRLQCLREEGCRFVLGPGSRWFILRCCLYDLNCELSRMRFRRKELKGLQEKARTVEVATKESAVARWA
jgi:hypothetical protein